MHRRSLCRRIISLDPSSGWKTHHLVYFCEQLYRKMCCFLMTVFGVTLDRYTIPVKSLHHYCQKKARCNGRAFASIAAAPGSSSRGNSKCFNAASKGQSPVHRLRRLSPVQLHACSSCCRSAYLTIRSNRRGERCTQSSAHPTDSRPCRCFCWLSWRSCLQSANKRNPFADEY